MALLNRTSRKVCEQICDRLNMPLKERGILLEKRYRAEKQLILIDQASSYTIQDLYWALIDFKTEYLLYMMALATHEETKKAISNFYTHQKTVKPYIRGRDLMTLGLKPSPVFTAIFNLILNEKLEGRLKTKKEELAFAAEYARNNKLID
jgi:tRNA nucleotidyltransferase (CCA-adding enzyme)